MNAAYLNAKPSPHRSRCPGMVSIHIPAGCPLIPRLKRHPVLPLQGVLETALGS